MSEPKKLPPATLRQNMIGSGVGVALMIVLFSFTSFGPFSTVGVGILLICLGVAYGLVALLRSLQSRA